MTYTTLRLVIPVSSLGIGPFNRLSLSRLKNKIKVQTKDCDKKGSMEKAFIQISLPIRNTKMIAIGFKILSSTTKQKWKEIVL